MGASEVFQAGLGGFFSKDHPPAKLFISIYTRFAWSECRFASVNDLMAVRESAEPRAVGKVRPSGRFIPRP